MSALIQTGFDYAALPVDSADRLQTIKRDIAIIDTLACVQIGQKLKEAQAELNMRGKTGSGIAADSILSAKSHRTLKARYQTASCLNLALL